jgi:two-component sensor histidine kinase
MLAIVTTFVGVRAGIATAVVGGVLSWYFVFNPRSWSLAHDAWIPLLGFVVVSTVIITTAKLYRSTARASHERELARLRAQAESAEFFAREMAHRLKNTLAIVQSLAFQTIGTNSEDATKFAGRLKALADANELLNEHVDTPSAALADVIEAALAPFGDLRQRFDVACVDASIPSQNVVSLALALHELTTNALKYGALSTTGGRVAINAEEVGERLRMTWKECRGPAVSEPRETGFGTRLLRRSGMNTELHFDADGVRCSMGLRKR